MTDVAAELAAAHAEAAAARTDVVSTPRGAVQRRPGETPTEAAYRAEIERLTAERDAARARAEAAGRDAKRRTDAIESTEREVEQLVEQLVDAQKQLLDARDELDDARNAASLARVELSNVKCDALTRVKAAERAMATAQKVARAQVADARRAAEAAWREHARERELRIIAQRSLDLALDTISTTEPVADPDNPGRATLKRAMSRAERAIARAVEENLGARHRGPVSRHATADRPRVSPTGAPLPARRDVT